VISLNNTASEIQRLKNRIEDKIRHAFLGENIQKPNIDENKLFTLSNIVPKDRFANYMQRDTYIITTMLVQIALDTHDLVPADNYPEESKDQLLTKQLHVLAGDYYSGLYYYLLSEAEDFKFINCLANAIKEINEQKMKFYYKEYNSYQEYIDLKISIETKLIENVSRFFKKNYLTAIWEKWIMIKQLLAEKECIYQENQLLITWLEEQQKGTISSYEEILDQTINETLLLFKKELEKLPQEYSDFKSFFNRKTHHFVYFNTSIVEEG